MRPPTVASSTQATAPTASASRAIPQMRPASRPKPRPARVKAEPSATVAGARGEPDSRRSLISQGGDRVDGFANHRLALIAVDLEGEQQPVREDGRGERLD